MLSKRDPCVTEQLFGWMRRRSAALEDGDEFAARGRRRAFRPRFAAGKVLAVAAGIERVT
jgi:hypothetical protein